MELKREKSQTSKLSCRRRASSDIFSTEPATNSQPGPSSRTASTPVRTPHPTEEEDSPYFPCSTQEINDEVDVLWDWNSPQSKPKTLTSKRTRKRLPAQQSPKVPFKRHPSSNQEQIVQDFNKLKEEIRALREEIAKPDHEESLVLSPIEEEAYKGVPQMGNLSALEALIQENEPENGFEDVFDDSMEEELIKFSQQIENEILKSDSAVGTAKNDVTRPGASNSVLSFSSKITKNKMSDNASVQNVGKFKGNTSNSVHVNLALKPQIQDSSEVFNDSFDMIISQMNNDDFDQLTQPMDIKQSQSESLQHCGSIQTYSGKVEFHRTQSFENFTNTVLSKEKLAEIERKKLEARAKREAKKRQKSVFTEVSESPLKCSPEEIEKKRREALAKLEARRMQETIERKRREALKRLEENRRKNAANVKSSLAKRL